VVAPAHMGNINKKRGAGYCENLQKLSVFVMNLLNNKKGIYGLIS